MPKAVLSIALKKSLLVESSITEIPTGLLSKRKDKTIFYGGSILSNVAFYYH